DGMKMRRAPERCSSSSARAALASASDDPGTVHLNMTDASQTMRVKIDGPCPARAAPRPCSCEASSRAGASGLRMPFEPRDRRWACAAVSRAPPWPLAAKRRYASPPRDARPRLSLAVPSRQTRQEFSAPCEASISIVHTAIKSRRPERCGGARPHVLERYAVYQLVQYQAPL